MKKKKVSKKYPTNKKSKAKKSTKKTKQRKSTKKVIKKTTKKSPAKKKYKSYYKPKKKNIGSAYIAPVNVKEVSEEELNKLLVPVVPTPSKRPVKYLNNRDLLAQVILSKKQMRMSNELAKMLQLLTSRYAKKGNFSGYTYNEDMQGYAMLMLVKTWNSFDPAKSSNPFAFFTQCIKNSFIQFLNSEKRQRDIKDEVLVDGGMMPSYSYQLEHSADNDNDTLNEQDNETVELPTKPIEEVRPFDPVPENGDLPEGENVGIVDAA